MEELKILNQKMFDDVKAFMKEIEVELDERGLIANANFCYIVGQKTNNKIDAKQMLQIYDFVTDVLQGKIPKIIIHVDKEDRIIWAKKMLKQCKTNDMTDDEIEFFAFCIVYSYFIGGMNEETGEMEQAIYDFTSLERIEKEYEYHKAEKIWKFDLTSYSDTTKDNYGYAIENPIEVTTVGMEYSYLGALVTEDGKDIIYDRIGSFTGENDIYVDGYEIYVKGLLTKKKIATLYITGDGTENSQTPPKGFKFKE